MDAKQAGQMDFNLPHDVVELPSRGVFYKSKKKSLKVGYLTANDENILANARKNGGQNIIQSLLRSKIYETEIKPEELLSGDVEAILIFLRNTSFGPEYTFEVSDDDGKKFETNVTIDELNIRIPEVNPKNVVQTIPNSQCPRRMKKKKMDRITKHGAQMSRGLSQTQGPLHQQAQLVRMKVVMSQASMNLQKTS